MRAKAHPGQIIKNHYLDPLNMTNEQLATHLSVEKHIIDRLITGDFDIDAELALRLSRACGNSAMFWMNLQAAYDLWCANEMSTSWQSVERLPGVNPELLSEKL